MMPGGHHFEDTSPPEAPHTSVTCVYCGREDKRTVDPLDPQNPKPLAARIRRTIPSDAECPNAP